MLVPVNVSPAGLVDQLPDFVGYLAPNLQNKCGCVVAHTVMSVKYGVTTACVLNPTDQDIVLREGMHLGEFFLVDESELVSLLQVAVETVSDVSPEELLPVSLEDLPASQQQKV